MVSILKQHESAHGIDATLNFLKLANSARKILADGYKITEKEIRLEDMPKAEKVKLWAESEGCENRLEWCKAVRFYKSI
jgi:hypothetical protein